jgi:hypothetical protein
MTTTTTTTLRTLLIGAAVFLAALLPLSAAQDDGWTTPEALRGGLHLVDTFDSSGPDAWDVEAYPLVYFTSESHYTHNPDLDAPEGFAGFHVIDAYGKEVIASVHFNMGERYTRGPHGVGVSPDGKWAYVGWSETPAGEREISYVAIVNTRTLKMDTLLMQESYYQGQMRRQRLHHVQSWTDVDGNDRVILQWGFGADGGPHQILDPNDGNRVVKSITYDDVHPQGHPFTTPSPDGKTVYVSMGSPEIRSAHSWQAGIAKVNLDTGAVRVIPEVGHHPIGITHTMDGRFTYVIEGHASYVIKIDNETNTVVGSTSAGVAGPYGLALNWDESLLFTIGKGEGSHNRGGVVGIVDTRLFSPLRSIDQPITLGGSASSIDHAILHPDPAVNEMWISNMAGWETIVLNLDTLRVTDYIATPNGGDTHSGAFVRYAPDWTGELLADMGGPKGHEMMETVRQNAAANQ